MAKTFWECRPELSLKPILAVVAGIAGFGGSLVAGIKIVFEYQYLGALILVLLSMLGLYWLFWCVAWAVEGD